MAGVSGALKEHNANIQIALADPGGSALHDLFTGNESPAGGNSLAEGIGLSFITDNLNLAQIDRFYKIADSEALPLLYKLIQQEGLCLGGSSAINIAGAVRLAKDLGPGHTIVTMLCDYGDRYRSKLYNPVFLRRRGLPVPDWVSG